MDMDMDAGRLSSSVLRCSRRPRTASVDLGERTGDAEGDREGVELEAIG